MKQTGAAGAGTNNQGSLQMYIQGLANRLQDIADRVPERVFAQTAEGALTFGQIGAAANEVAARLLDRELVKGDRVVVMMANSLGALAVIHGLMRAGLVWVPVNPSLVGEPLAHVIRTTQPGLVICDAGVEPALADCDAAQGIPVEILRDRGLPAGGGVPATSCPDPADLAAIMFTSGTTGPAKGVMVSHMMLELAAEGVALCADLVPGDNLFMWEPFYHIGGAQVIVLPLIRDVHLTIADRFSASRFWQDVAQGGCTHIHHLGGIIQILLKQPPGPQDRAHKVRIAWGGGCATEAWRPFEDRFGVQIRECYGMTECSSLTTWNDEGVVGAVGRPMPWFDIDLRAEDGRILGPGEGRGEIVVRSSLSGAITQGYFRNPEATARALRPEGFRTGDLGSWDAEGRLFFHGRMTDSVRCKGENVSAFEVESVAARHPQVVDAAMVGVKADIGENDILLFIQPQPGHSPDPAEIWQWMARQLAPHQRPRYIALVPDFPRTPSQRIQKHLLPDDPALRWDRLSAAALVTPQEARP
ncbi:crotonobetaine/carnitine-CoA ligase [Gemmobacter megaterium]|uniref:Crotonobetaine/carnitine-CoA ligase n=1 Tax=Gemmobacter megaterium TaxID=1086013 RepID=A0A1N7KGT2_9RHOB|nr:AMP-binding protein [Gemmobacter megaterium]GGE02099.1 ATP-dependent acyl-CoA ligase [Gemmobacter megaterium]SIS60811.1 crotonobetaine/carnitine-CoA ligase [Gemmobacter megaterium]